MVYNRIVHSSVLQAPVFCHKITLVNLLDAHSPPENRNSNARACIILTNDRVKTLVRVASVDISQQIESSDPECGDEGSRFVTHYIRGGCPLHGKLWAYACSCGLCGSSGSSPSCEFLDGVKCPAVDVLSLLILCIIRRPEPCVLTESLEDAVELSPRGLVLWSDELFPDSGYREQFDMVPDALSDYLIRVLTEFERAMSVRADPLRDEEWNRMPECVHHIVGGLDSAVDRILGHSRDGKGCCALPIDKAVARVFDTYYCDRTGRKITQQTAGAEQRARARAKLAMIENDGPPRPGHGFSALHALHASCASVVDTDYKACVADWVKCVWCLCVHMEYTRCPDLHSLCAGGLHKLRDAVSRASRARNTSPG